MDHTASYAGEVGGRMPTVAKNIAAPIARRGAETDAPRDVRSSASFAPAAHVAKRARTDESGSAAAPTESRDRQGREGRWTTRERTAPEVPLPRRARTGARAPRRAKTEARAPRRADARASVDADGADVAGVRITSDFVRGEARLLVPERGSAPRPRRIMMSGPRREDVFFGGTSPKATPEGESLRAAHRRWPRPVPRIVPDTSSRSCARRAASSTARIPGR